MSEPDSIGKPLRLVGWSGESPRSAGGGPKHPAGYRDARLHHGAALDELSSMMINHKIFCS
jgi:hypothetical protein